MFPCVLVCFGLLHYKLQHVLEGSIFCGNLRDVLDGNTSLSKAEELRVPTNEIQPDQYYVITIRSYIYHFTWDLVHISRHFGNFRNS